MTEMGNKLSLKNKVNYRRELGKRRKEERGR